MAGITTSFMGGSDPFSKMGLTGEDVDQAVNAVQPQPQVQQPQPVIEDTALAFAPATAQEVDSATRTVQDKLDLANQNIKNKFVDTNKHLANTNQRMSNMELMSKIQNSTNLKRDENKSALGNIMGLIGMFL